jgi:hypothetical protein
VSSQAGLFRKYALDSSFLIDIWTREGSHPRDIHVGLWEHFDGQCERGEVIAPFEVREELENAYDQALDRWLRARREIFIEIRRPQLEVLQEIVRKYPAFTQGPRNMADPAVVALAFPEGLTVLTSERYQASPSPTEPKIPNVCEEYGMVALGVNDYMRAESIILS